MTVRLTTQPLVVAPLLAAVQSEANGGTALFLGTVRRSAEDGEVAGIAYSAYEAMAEEELERIVSEAREHWPGAAVDVRHRLGYVATGEASVAVAAAAPHRADAGVLGGQRSGRPNPRGFQRGRALHPGETAAGHQLGQNLTDPLRTSRHEFHRSPFSSHSRASGMTT